MVDGDVSAAIGDDDDGLVKSDTDALGDNLNDVSNDQEEIEAVVKEDEGQVTSDVSFDSALERAGAESRNFFNRPDLKSRNLIKSVFQLDNGRVCLLVVNSDRQSRFRGVYSQPSSTRWCAFYKSKTKHVEYKYLGTMDTEVEAAVAYDIEVTDLFQGCIFCIFCMFNF
jgi:hypothetical protein